MFNGSESPEAIEAWHQERLRQICRTANQLEVERLLEQQPAAPRSGPFRRWLDAIARQLRPPGRTQQLPGG